MISAASEWTQRMDDASNSAANTEDMGRTENAEIERQLPLQPKLKGVVDLSGNESDDEGAGDPECSSFATESRANTGSEGPTLKKKKKKKSFSETQLEERYENSETPSSTEPSTPPQHPFANPNALDEKVTNALVSIAKSAEKLDVKRVTRNLRDIIVHISQELSHNWEGGLEWKTIDEVPKGLPKLLQNFPRFLAVLDMSPAPMPVETKPVDEGAGMHRIALVELLNHLLVPVCPCIEEAMLAAGTPARLVSLFFQFPWNSILQGATFRSLQAMLGKPSLRYAVIKGDDGLASVLPREGQKCVKLPIGKRPGYSGYVARLSEDVTFLAKNDKVFQNILNRNEHWSAYAGLNGALKQLLTENAGHLGGPT